MHENRKVPLAVVKRLPRYYRYLGDLIKNNIQRISSGELSRRMDVTASQIRQDLNFFGGFGQQGYGYNVKYLYNEIGEILGINNIRQMIIIGAGNLGQALANYKNFRKRGFEIIGIFDIRKDLIGKKINGVTIRDYNEIEGFLNENTVDIAILSIPRDKTFGVAENLVRCGIKALWNFSPMDLKFARDIVVENVHLSDSLMTLAYKLNQLELDSTDYEKFSS